MKKANNIIAVVAILLLVIPVFVIATISKASVLPSAEVAQVQILETQECTETTASPQTRTVSKPEPIALLTEPTAPSGITPATTLSEMAGTTATTEESVAADSITTTAQAVATSYEPGNTLPIETTTDVLENETVKTILDSFEDCIGDTSRQPASPDRPWRILTHTNRFMGCTTKFQYGEEVTVRNDWEMIDNPDDWTFTFWAKPSPATDEDFAFEYVPADVEDYAQWCRESPFESCSSLTIISEKEGIQITAVPDSSNLLVNVIVGENQRTTVMPIPENRGFVVVKETDQLGDTYGYSIDNGLLFVACAAAATLAG